AMISGSVSSRKAALRRKTAGARPQQLRPLSRRLTVRFAMQDGRARILSALCCALGLAFCLAFPRAASAQDWAGSAEGSTTDGPSVEQYLNDAGPDVKYVEHGQLKIDGKAV